MENFRITLVYEIARDFQCEGRLSIHAKNTVPFKIGTLSFTTFWPLIFNLP